MTSTVRATVNGIARKYDDGSDEDDAIDDAGAPFNRRSKAEAEPALVRAKRCRPLISGTGMDYLNEFGKTREIRSPILPHRDLGGKA